VLFRSDGQLGGQNVWNGGVYLLVVPTDTAGTPTGATATVSCELKVNGVSQGTVLGPTTGTGVVADAAQIQFTAEVTDVVSLCDHVTVGSETIVFCGDATTTQLVPQPVIDAIDSVFDVLITVAETVDGVIATVFDLLNELVLKPTDVATCAALVAIAPVANTLGPDVIFIDGTGDTWIGGVSEDTKFWDCPPYDV